MQASQEIARKHENRLVKEENKAKKLASAFRARPLPLSSVTSSSIISQTNTIHNDSNNRLIGLDILSDDGSVQNSFDTIIDESTPPKNSISSISELHSSVRARGRAAFERRRRIYQKEKVNQKENIRSQQSRNLCDQRKNLMESIR